MGMDMDGGSDGGLEGPEGETSRDGPPRAKKSLRGHFALKSTCISRIGIQGACLRVFLHPIDFCESFHRALDC
ncbi:hypothetical protein M569_16851 [Genlisea aurea]|uniref:Uncharacterized protein n=1 Tax=Genlisea aurea TaxID=192259 RepID=S8C0L2_9LAMI|nr:hypothetical protein M569_16851 [Genlisea aurea]